LQSRRRIAAENLCPIELGAVAADPHRRLESSTPKAGSTNRTRFGTDPFRGGDAMDFAVRWQNSTLGFPLFVQRARSRRQGGPRHLDLPLPARH
jgi:hypothetical protein